MMGRPRRFAWSLECLRSIHQGEEILILRTLIASNLLAVVPGASAQDAYPSSPITMIVPFPPGGVADLVGRPTAAAKSAPDGYTILMGLSSISIFPVSDRLNGKKPAYEMKDLVPVALVSADPTVLVVRDDSPHQSLADFVAAAKANPGKINYSSSVVYGTLHVAMEIFTNAAGLKLFHVPYQGGGPAVTALLGGQVEAFASGPAAGIGQIKAGKMRALAGCGEKRRALMPELPTFKELDYDAEYKDAARLKTAVEKIGKIGSN